MGVYIHKFYSQEAADTYRESEEYVEPFVGAVVDGEKLLYNKQYVTGITIDKLKWHVDVPATGGTATKDNCKYVVNVHYNVEGLKADVTDLAEVTGSLVVESSFTEERHSAGTLTLTATYEGLESSGSVKVYQEAFVPSVTAITFEDLEWVENIPKSGGTATSANCTFKVYAEYDNGTEKDITALATVTGSLEVSASTESKTHSAGTLVLTASYEEFTASGSVVVYQDGDIAEPLTFVVLSGGTIGFQYRGDEDASAKTIEYKVNDGGWTSFTPSTATPLEISVESGDEVKFRGDNDAYSYQGNVFYSHNFYTADDAIVTLGGNIMSLINSVNFKNTTILTAPNAFDGIFETCEGLISAEDLVLPATALTLNCYSYMFSNCTSLTSAPELPATTLADGCYGSMFGGCSSLTTAPVLPATTLAEYCYTEMFYNCASLTTAPELPATTLASNCYQNMFQDCTSLTSAPELPATILVDYCYQYMFAGCTNLSFIKCLATDISAENCTESWVGGVAPTGIFIMNQNATDWEIGENGIPTGWLAGDTEDTFITGDEITIFESGGSKSVSVYSTANQWTASTVDSWITLGANTGDTGLTNLTITAQATTSGRTGSVTITDGETTKALTVIQDNKAIFLRQPLTLNIISGSNGRIWWVSGKYANSKEIKYKKNDESWWTSKTSSTSSSPIYVNAGDKIEIVGDNDTYGRVWNGTHYGNYFSASTDVRFSVEGNIMSLINSSNYAQLSAFTADYAFVDLFNSCTGLTSAENLMLPATTLVRSCYYNMFLGCTSLTTAPELPATTLAINCYYQMFRGCTSLATAPSLPATTLASYCYQHMFQGCTSLTTAPVLPVTTLTESCYSSMFGGCTSLTTAPELPATTLAYGCYNSMFQGCTSLTTAPELPVTTLARYCYRDMFYGCTSLTTAPELPATILADSCYYEMFHSCTSLNYIKCLATDISASNCTYNWVNGVASSGTFVKPSTTDWSSKTGNNGIPTNWTVQDAS